jgi:hypothetical protein
VLVALTAGHMRAEITGTDLMVDGGNTVVAKMMMGA